MCLLNAGMNYLITRFLKQS